MSNVVEKLESIGIKVDPYRRGPLGKDVFSIGINGDTLRVWDGNGEISVSTNKRYKQAVINVREKPRKIKIKNYHYFDPNEVIPKDIKSYIEKKYKGRERDLIKYHDIPNVRNTKILSVTDPEFMYCWITIEVTVAGSKFCFLVGYDSNATRPFVSRLKKSVKTVEEAHKELLPKNVVLKSGHKRHGEWFLNPVNKKLEKELFAILTQSNKVLFNWSLNNRNPSRFYQNVSSHRASTFIRHNNKSYVCGVIKDIRVGRHKPLILNGFYEVIRNNEVQVQAKTRNWD